MELELLSGWYAVARLEPASRVPGWARGPGFVSITHTADETSVVCDEEQVPEGVTSESGFVGLKVPGPIPFTEVGVLESIARPLAAAGVSVFVVSTFDTDYVFIREAELEKAGASLAGAGHSLR